MFSTKHRKVVELIKYLYKIKIGLLKKVSLFSINKETKGTGVSNNINILSFWVVLYCDSKAVSGSNAHFFT